LLSTRSLKDPILRWFWITSFGHGSFFSVGQPYQTLSPAESSAPHVSMLVHLASNFQPSKLAFLFPMTQVHHAGSSFRVATRIASNVSVIVFTSKSTLIRRIRQGNSQAYSLPSWSVTIGTACTFRKNIDMRESLMVMIFCSLCGIRVYRVVVWAMSLLVAPEFQTCCATTIGPQ